MGIKLRKGCDYRSVCHLLHVNGIDIIALHLLQNKVELAPAVVVPVEFPVQRIEFARCYRKQHTDDNPKQCNKQYVTVTVPVHDFSPLFLLQFRPSGAGPPRPSAGIHPCIQPSLSLPG